MAIHCQRTLEANYRYPHGDVLISPDARRIVYASGQYMNMQHVLHAARLEDASGWTDYDANLGWSSRFLVSGRGRAAFEWSSDSRFIWAAKMDHVGAPIGWASGPLRLIRAEDGKDSELASVRHKAGPLDGVQWVGHNGKALALFGVRGSFQQPPRTDKSPTIAMIDAERAEVLDAHPIVHAPLFIVEGVILPDGRIRAVLITPLKATLWTQGEPLVELPIDVREAVAAALSPDGQSVLVQYALPVREFCDKICAAPCVPPPKCRRGPPNEGVFGALYGMPDGRTLWTFRARREAPSPYDSDPIPAISPDGNYALIGLPFAAQRTTMPPRLALISMRDGKIEQTMRAVGQRSALGFAQSSAIAWTHDMGVTVFYGVEGKRR